MSTTLGLLEDSPTPSQPDRNLSPARILAGLMALIFLAEVVSMVVIRVLPLPNYTIETLLDGLIMLVLIFPGLYYLQLSPLMKQINERTRAETALRSSEKLLSRVLELLPVGVWITDQSGMIVHANPASQKIWAGARYVGIEEYGEYKAWWADTGKRIEPEEWAGARAITRGETSLNDEVEIESFDGSHKIILNSAVPILDAQNAIQGAIIVNQDITRRRQEEKARIQTNELLERFFSSIDTLIAYMDREFNFIRVNDTYAKSGGYPPEYFIGKNHFDLYPHAENQAIFQRVVETGEPFSVLEKPFEYAEFPELGVTYWDWGLQPVKGADGRVEGVVLSLVDVTERKRADILLARKNEELRELYQAEATARQAAETMSAAAQALTQTLDLDHVIHTLLDHIHLIIQSDTAGVNLFEDESRRAVHTIRGYGRWEEHDDIPSVPIDGIADSAIQRMILSRNSLTITNLMTYPVQGNQPGSKPIAGWLVVPIIASDKIIGFVELGRGEGGLFSPEETRWANALAGQAAIAIQNAWLFEQVRASSERLQSLARKLVEVQENERFHIARELHDEAGQALSSLKLSLGRLEQDPDCPPHVRQRLADLKCVADGVLEELHRLAMDLRPATLDHLGLVAAIEQYAHHLNSEQLAVQFKAVGFGEERLPASLEVSLYRIVQEALTNVARYAQASTVGILLERGMGRVKVFVEDNGTGFEPETVPKGKHLGLVGIRERAEMLGGSLTIESAPGRGTSIIVEVPDANPYPYRG